MYLRQRPKSKNWASLMPHSSATVRCTENSTDPGNSLALGLQRGVNSISLQCIPWPVACSEWGACLTDFDRSSTFRFRHPDYDPDRVQKLISSSMSRHLSTRKISSKSMHAFLSNLANRWQTDRQTSRGIAYTSSFVEGKLYQKTCDLKLCPCLQSCRHGMH